MGEKDTNKWDQTFVGDHSRFCNDCYFSLRSNYNESKEDDEKDNRFARYDDDDDDR